jgi:hypothetical protein
VPAGEEEVMTEFVFRLPIVLLFVALGIVAVAVLRVALRKGETRRKVASIAIVAIVAGALLVFLFRATTLTVDEAGLRTAGVTKLELSWDEIEAIVLERDLDSSDYRPAMRTRGVSIGPYRSGRFVLSNGNPGQLLMERSDQALVILTSELTYLFSPTEMDVLFDAVSDLAVGPEIAR